VFIVPARRLRAVCMEPVALSSACPACEGHGRIPARPGGARTELCPACRGKGLALTGDGEAITGLLKTAGLDRLTPEG
jgi:DnaJ-class molecular chaperone